MEYIMKKLISHGAVLEKLDVDALMKELTIAREANLVTVSIKTSVENAMAKATSVSDQVESVSTSITQLVTTG